MSGHLALGSVGALAPVDATTVAEATTSSPPLSIAPQKQCQLSDKPETGLQGQVPWADRLSGRAAQGYSCNLVELSRHQSNPPGLTATENGCCTLDYYRDKAGHDCAYYGDALPGTTGAGVPVMDISDPQHPVQTAKLTTRAMQASAEGMRVNARRGLLVADEYNGTWFDVYDISGDCRHPALMSTQSMPSAQGHEGCFAPDGKTFYMGGDANSPFPPYQPIDLTDPAHPREMGGLDMLGGMHGCSISDDGRTGYFCQQQNGSALWTVDLTDFELRRSNPQARVISILPFPDVTWCQSTYPVTYGKHPYVIRYGESSPVGADKCTSSSATNFDHPHIVDMADRTQPKVASSIALEVDDPANCLQVMNDYTQTTDPGVFAQILAVGFAYDDHHCSPDRLHDPTILVCAQWLAGLRVYDIRDPLHPKELAYFNPGTLGIGNPTVDMSDSRPVILADRGEILFASLYGGLHVLKFENGTWPATGYGCPSKPDYYFAQYNPDSHCSG